MLEIIALIFLCRRIGNKAIEKGLKPGQWKFFTVLAWVFFELIGVIIGIILFGFDKNDLVGLMIFVLFCGFGGYLLVNAILDRKPTLLNDDDVENIGN